jgi:hypothetical protein
MRPHSQIPFVVVLILEWLVGGAVQQLVMVVTSVERKEVLERWCFKLDTALHKGVNGQTYVSPHAQKMIQTAAPVLGTNLKRRS